MVFYAGWILGKKAESIKSAGLREAVGQAADAIVITDPVGVIQFVNPAFTSMTGYSSEEVVGNSTRVLKSGRHTVALYKELWSTIRAGEVWCGEVFNRRKDGSTYLEEMRIAPLKGPQGNIKGYVAIKRDVTERRAADEARRFLASMVETSAGGILAFDSSGTILTWNTGAEAILGYSGCEVVGQQVSMLLLPEQKSTFDQHAQEVLRGNSVPLTGSYAVHKDGRRIPVSTTAWPIRDSLGEVTAVSMIFRDESMRERVENTRALLASIVESSADAISSVDLDGTILSWNPACELMYGYSRKEAVGRNITSFAPVAERDRAKGILEKVRHGGAIGTFETLLERKDGALTHVSARLSVIRNAAGEVVGSSAIMTDITDRIEKEKALEASEARYRTVYQTSLDGIAITRMSDGRYIDANKTFLDLMGYEQVEVLGKTTLTLDTWVNPEERKKWVAVLRRDSKYCDAIVQLRKKNGEVFWSLNSSSAIQIDGTECVMTVVRDISKAREAEEKIRNLAFYDPLTGVANRLLLTEHLNQALASASQNSRKGGILFIDVDHLKRLNDTLGHRAGDMLIHEVARRLKASVGESDTVGRFAGDEFVVLIKDLGEDPTEAAAQIQAIGEKILKANRASFLIEGHEIENSCSIGITLFGNPDESADQILQEADIAMYQAKTGGGNAVQFFAPALKASVSARAAMENDLREAIRSEQFELYYQPQIDHEELIGAEALIRWKRPGRGFVPPNQFIPVAEETGLILQIGSWAMKTACQQIAILAQSEETASLTVAVNISAREFRQPDFIERVLSAVFTSNANPRKLKLELTESMLVDNITDVIGKMTELKAFGVRFSLDDFGTGYSSLSYLKRLPLDQLKIDRSFVRDMLENGNSGVIAQTIISLSKALGLSVIAEGVETEEQREFLARHGCYSYQGYLFSRPVPFEEFLEMCRTLPENRARRLSASRSGCENRKVIVAIGKDIGMCRA